MNLWTKLWRWIIRKDAVLQQRPVNQAINTEAAKVIDPLVK